MARSESLQDGWLRIRQQVEATLASSGIDGGAAHLQAQRLADLWQVSAFLEDAVSELARGEAIGGTADLQVWFDVLLHGLFRYYRAVRYVIRQVTPVLHARRGVEISSAAEQMQPWWTGAGELPDAAAAVVELRSASLELVSLLAGASLLGMGDRYGRRRLARIRVLTQRIAATAANVSETI